jgi:hypothetical protein
LDQVGHRHFKSFPTQLKQVDFNQRPLMLTLEMLATQEGRKKVIQFTESKDNIGRKAESYRQTEVYYDRLKNFVVEELRQQFSEQTISEMPLVKSVNIAKRCVNNQAMIYSNAPERTWSDLSDVDEETMWKIYHDMGANKKLDFANKMFKLHKQVLLQVIPKNGKLIMRVLHPHQWDVITSEDDPERAVAYIISAYDKTENFQDNQVRPGTGRESITGQYTRNYIENADMRERENQEKKTYVVWTEQDNFMMNGRGEILGEVLPNPIGFLPFVEVSEQKDFEYWVRQANAYTDFTIEFNAAMTETRQTVKMQSFAVAIVKAPKEMRFNNLQIGPNYILHLPNDEVNGIKTEFEFASPSANIEGSIRFLEVMLSGFLSSNGIDPKTVTMNGESSQFTSGLDRLLSLIDKMQASKSDYDLFSKAESDLYDLVKRWMSVLRGSQSLDPEYSVQIPDDSELTILYHHPEMVQSESDKLDTWSKKIEMGLASPIHAIMQLEGLSRDQALEKYKEIQADQEMSFEEEAENEAQVQP